MIVKRDRNILVLLGCYLPGYKAGGPIRSIENLVAALGREFHFRIVTLDRDLGDHASFPGIAANSWTRVGDADVLYVQPGLRGLCALCGLLCSIDRNTTLYLNSFFARRFSMLPMFLRRIGLCQAGGVILAPRGEFSPGALQLKPTRKVWYMRIFRGLKLHGGVVWQASSDFEAKDIRRQFSMAERIEVAAVIPGLDGRGAHSEWAGFSGAQKTPGNLRAVFISRFSRKKNLAGALSLLQGISGEVCFNIYGPTEDTDYWEECQRLIAAMPPNIRVRYRGEIEHARVGQVFSEHHLFLFPTLGENYGHVIAEALASGCPVLISDQTPWRNLEAEGVGWDIPPGEPERFRRVLQQCVDGDQEWQAAISSRAMRYAARRSSDPEILEANRKLFLRACAAS